MRCGIEMRKAMEKGATFRAGAISLCETKGPQLFYTFHNPPIPKGSRKARPLPLSFAGSADLVGPCVSRLGTQEFLNGSDSAGLSQAGQVIQI